MEKRNVKAGDNTSTIIRTKRKFGLNIKCSSSFVEKFQEFALTRSLEASFLRWTLK